MPSFRRGSGSNDPTKDAERILQTVWGSSDAVPVDPVQIARRLGIDVLNASLARNVAAALVKKPGEDPVIFLNSKDSPNRQRFSCAHEIGHFVKRSDEPDAYEYIDLRDVMASTGEKPEEVYANQFAAALLMPEKVVRRFHRKGMGEVELAAVFGVSREAMHFRLKNLGLA